MASRCSKLLIREMLTRMPQLMDIRKNTRARLFLLVKFPSEPVFRPRHEPGENSKVDLDLPESMGFFRPQNPIMEHFVAKPRFKLKLHRAQTYVIDVGDSVGLEVLRLTRGPGGNEGTSTNNPPAGIQSAWKPNTTVGVDDDLIQPEHHEVAFQVIHELIVMFEKSIDIITVP